MTLKKIENINTFKKLCKDTKGFKYNVFYGKINAIDENSLVYEIIKSDGTNKNVQGKVIGIVALYDYEMTNKTIKINGYLYDYEDYRDLKKAMVEMYRIAFEEMGIEKLIMEFPEFDVIKDPLSSDMRLMKEGRLRSHIQIHGQRYTLAVYSILKHEYLRFFMNKEKVHEMTELMITYEKPMQFGKYTLPLVE